MANIHTLSLPLLLLQLRVIGTVSSILDTVPNILGFAGEVTEVVAKNVLTMNPNLKTNFFDPDFTKNTTEQIRGLGYPVEEHKVTTSDGYILGIFRIPHGVSNGNQTNKTAVLVLPGIAQSSSVFALNYFAYQNFATVLADAGYDVFLGNYRGNAFAREHVKLKADNPKFWEFSMDEIALIDVPAMIDFVLSTTGQEQLHYVGYSMGTTMMIALLSTNTTSHYNDKIKIAALMAPVAKLDFVTAPIAKLYQFGEPILSTLSLFGAKGEFPANYPLKDPLIDAVCGNGLTDVLCRIAIDILGGIESGHLNRTRLPVYVYHLNAGTSTNVFDHNAQIISSGRFQMFDFGPEKNLKKYGKEMPPEYDVSRIRAPLALYSNKGDALATQKDIDFLRQNFKKGVLVKDFIVEIENYQHLDFIFGVDAYKYLYQYIVQLLNENR